MSHKTVFLTEAVDALAIKPHGVYIDATFGRGGHARLILSRLNAQGRLIVCDQDLSAIAVAQTEFGQDPRVNILHGNFGQLEQYLKALDLWSRVDGILFDLGISSPQVDEAARGFSFLQEGPLDMRMAQSRGLPVAEQLKTLDEQALTEILRSYGEEKFAAKISRAVLAALPTTTRELADLIAEAIPKRFHEPHKNPATRSFQALRIWVNRELAMLEAALAFFPQLLALQGRAVFISFHSLEDRLVKERMRVLSSPPAHPRGLPIRSDAEDSPPMRICIKMQKPSEDAVRENLRARSAVLRVMERLR